MPFFKKKPNDLEAQVNRATAQASIAMMAFTQTASQLNAAADTLDELAGAALAKSDQMAAVASGAEAEAERRRNQANSIHKMVQGAL